MKTVLAAGVFDFFHPGHEFFLREAKKLGEKLVVIIARDVNVQRIKNITPTYSEEKRLALVKKSGIADAIFLGNEGEDFLEIVKKINPDILALGYDQKAPNEFIKEFTNTKIVQIDAKNAEEWKSSRYRK